MSDEDCPQIKSVTKRGERYFNKIGITIFLVNNDNDNICLKKTNLFLATPFFEVLEAWIITYI